MKSKLLLDGIHITYFDNTAYSLNIKNKTKLINLKKINSHQIVFECYSKEYIQRDKLLTLEIYNKEAGESSKLYEWYEDKRNVINYRSIRFEEPLLYSFWEQVADYDNVEDLFIKIIKDNDNYIYVTDEDYAIIAIPIFCLIDIMFTVDVKSVLCKDEFNCIKEAIKQNTYCLKLFNSIDKLKCIRSFI